MGGFMNKCVSGNASFNFFTSLTILCVVSISTTALAGNDENIVTQVLSAPVVANGINGDEPSEFHIWLNAPKSPSTEHNFNQDYFGHQIPAGGKMVVQLGGTFQRNPDFVGNLKASFNVIPLNGHPQNPIVHSGGSVPTHHGNWALTDDGDLQFTITPKAGVGTNGLAGDRAKKIGFKIIHIRPDPRGGNGSFTNAPYLNGPAGTVGTASVAIYDIEGMKIESGFGSVMFEESVGRQVFINNADIGSVALPKPTTETSLVESANWQHVSPNTELTIQTRSPAGVDFFADGNYAPRFIIFEKQVLQSTQFRPFAVVPGQSYTVDADEPWHAALTENGITIGTIIMDGPSENSRGSLLPAAIGATASIGVPCIVGSEKGLYSVKINLLDGNEATAYIVVE
jgi:hypothetical protein